MEREEKDRVGSLREKLYSQTRYKAPADVRRPVGHLEGTEVNEKWGTPELDEMLTHERTVSAPNPFMKRFFIAAVVFFVVTLGVAVFMMLGGSNFISSKNVDINILGPISITAGEVLELGVTISNFNNADLEMVNFSVQYPQGTRDASDTSRSLTYTKEEIGSIGAGAEAVRDLKMVLIGSTGEVRELKFSVEYKVKGSNATFYKDKIYEITIGNSPVSLSIERPVTITSGETFTTLVSVTLNSTEILRGVMLKAEYPHGYSFNDSSPQAASDNNVWSLGDLTPGERKTVSIRGNLVGENNEERTFRFYIGISDLGNVNTAFNNLIISSQETMRVARPSLGLNVSLNGTDSATHVAPAAQSVSTSIRYQNNMPERLINPRLEARLSGSALDRFSVSTFGGGFYNSENNTIVWDIINNAGARELLSGQSGSVSFSFASLQDLATLSGSREIQVEFVLTGIPQSSVLQQPVTVTERRTVRIASQVSLSGRTTRSQGPFVNSGPIPPKVGQETTYSIILSAGNTQNDVTGAKVTATLGANVGWLGSSSSESESISYNPNNNTVTWEIGALSSGTGFSSPARSASFQVSFIPSISQIGATPTLVSGISFTGTDSFTNNSIILNHSPLTTLFSSDPVFIQGDERVVN